MMETSTLSVCKLRFRCLESQDKDLMHWLSSQNCVLVESLPGFSFLLCSLIFRGICRNTAFLGLLGFALFVCIESLKRLARLCNLTERVCWTRCVFYIRILKIVARFVNALLLTFLGFLIYVIIIIRKIALGFLFGSKIIPIIDFYFMT